MPGMRRGPGGAMHIEPALPVGAMKTYEIKSPNASHFRPATCAEVGCEKYLGGWKVRVQDLAPDIEYVVRTSGRKFTEVSIAEGETYLVFEAGQPCFSESIHQLPVGRPEIYLVKGGDWRGNPRGEIRRHVNPDDWVDDFANHQIKLAERLERG